MAGSAGSEGILAVVLAIATAGYMGWKPVFGILYGSIYSMLGRSLESVLAVQ